MHSAHGTMRRIGRAAMLSPWKGNARRGRRNSARSWPHIPARLSPGWRCFARKLMRKPSISRGPAHSRLIRPRSFASKWRNGMARKIWIIKGIVTDPQAYDGKVPVGTTEWQFSDGPDGDRTRSDDFLSLEEGKAAFPGAEFIMDETEYADEIQSARDTYCNDECEIEASPRISVGDS